MFQIVRIMLDSNGDVITRRAPLSVFTGVKSLAQTRARFP
jgi:hypothetical protein